MADKIAQNQQPVISIRISDALRIRLEKLKEIMSVQRKGEPVSTSEAAKQLLESAREERLEFVNLLADPTDSLLNIRRKADGGLPLSLAEWTLIAYYCHIGAESFTTSVQGQISDESLAGILEAFLAAYALIRRTKPHGRDFGFVMFLPADKQVEAKDAADVGPDDVRRVVSRTIQMLKSKAEKKRKPFLCVRNLYALLDEEKFGNINRLNDALWPHWTTLWAVCARGHYARHGKPLREPVSTEEKEDEFDAMIEPPLPAFEEGEFQMEFRNDKSQEFAPLLRLPGPHSPIYPIPGYPRIAEFRRMLDGLDLTRPFDFWEGFYFHGYTEPLDETRVGVVFRGRENGIVFHFSVDDWQIFRALFARAWQSPAVKRRWETLAIEYGEL